MARARDGLADDHRELALELTACAIAGGALTRLYDDPAVAAAMTAQTDDDSIAAREVLAGVAFHHFIRGTLNAEESARLAERALGDGRLARAAPESPAATPASHLLIVTDRVEAADTAIRAGLEGARERGSELAFAMWSVTDCARGFFLGDLAEAEAAGRLALAASAGFAGQLGAVAYLVPVLVERDLLDEAEDLLDRHPPVGARVVDVYARRARVQLLLAQHRWERAAALSLALGDELAARGVADHPTMWWRTWAATALGALGRRDEALAVIAAAHDNARAARTPRSLGPLLRAEGLIRGGEDGLRCLEDAVEVLHTIPAPLEQTRTLVELGAMQRRLKLRAEARETLKRGLDLADRCGALRLAGRAREELAATGAKPRRARLTGVDALTPSELRVARMAASGLSNLEIAQALFVTRKTVESQLGAAYRKLDINARGALPGALTANL